MSIAELQKSIIEKVGAIQEEEKLTEIRSLINMNKSDSLVYHFSPEELLELDEIEEQVNSGKFYTNEAAQKELGQWLSK